MFDLMFGSSLRIGQRAIFLACIVFALMHVFASAHEVTDQAVPPLVIERQGSFFVGGRDVRSDKLSPFPTIYDRIQLPWTKYMFTIKSLPSRDIDILLCLSMVVA